MAQLASDLIAEDGDGIFSSRRVLTANELDNQ